MTVRATAPDDQTLAQVSPGTTRCRLLATAPDPALAAACVHAGIARYTHPSLVARPPLPAMKAFLLRGLMPRGGARGAYSEAGLAGGAGSEAEGCGPS